MEEQRPNPQKLLASIQEQEDQSSKGKLKIFFGYAAGVGKTYAMLEAAHEAKKAGRDVVVGYVERHTRPDTLALLEGLEQIPYKKIDYKGVTLREFDLDTALKRRPDLILVDELAHTNVKGCRNEKRYQDVKELLRAGIDVYTTMNIQHLESLNDIVGNVTHIEVRERVPDKVFDHADQVEVIDIEPEELLHILEAINNGSTYFEKDETYIEELTETEKQVLLLLAGGTKRKEIAEQLFMSERTVSNHLQHIFEKLGVSSAVEAITKAIQLGYIPPL